MKKTLKYALIFLGILLSVPLFLLVLLLLLFPIRYKISAKIDKKKDIRVKLSYLFGLFRYVYLLDDRQKKGCFWILCFKCGSKSKTTQRKKTFMEKIFSTDDIFLFVQKNIKKILKEEVCCSKGKPISIKDGLTLQEIKTIIKDSVSTLKKLVLAVRPGYFRFSGEVGLRCPAKTAYLYGLFMAMSHWFGVGKNISLSPVFENDSTVVFINAEARGFVYVYGLLFPLVGLVLGTPIKKIILKGASE